MKLRRELLFGVERFLSLIPVKTRECGHDYFGNGCVLSLLCIKPESLYAAVVRGGEEYQVELEFAENVWSSNCSCPMGYDCKHAVAAMLELKRLATQSEPVPGAGVLPRQAQSSQNPGQQVPRSPLLVRVLQKLSRGLQAPEMDYIRKVQMLFIQGEFRPLTWKDLLSLNRRSVLGRHWEPLELWEEFPPDDFYFWLHLARELRRRGVKIPSFMEEITELGLIEAGMLEWERAKEIARWSRWFQDFDGRAAAKYGGLLDLRLVILPEEARLQWRLSQGAEFTELKQAQAKRFAEQFEHAELQFTPESLPLWSAVFKPWHYESWWSFKYSQASTSPALNRLLRLPLAPDRIVTADGRMLPRIAEPLRLILSTSEQEVSEYELALAMADGSAPPRFFCILNGQPTLYLTGSGLFSGPAAGGLDTGLKRSIPAPALETTEGVRFLQSAGVVLPESLARRVRSVPVEVTISCSLKALPNREDIIFEVGARIPGMGAERFTLKGWESEQRAVHPPAPAKTSESFITVHDRSVQDQMPGLLGSLGLKWEGYPGDWRLRVTKKTPELFTAWLRSLPSGVEVLLDRELATLRDEPVSGSVSLDVQESGMDWFDLKVVLNVGDTTLTAEELKLLLNARGGFVRLGKKGWRRLEFNLTPEEDEQLARLGLHSGDFSAEPQRFHALQLADDAAKKFLAPGQIEKIRRRVCELQTRVAPLLPESIQAGLRPYQTEGFHFLAYLTANRFGGVLADDMGLGKTLQTLAWLAWLREGSGAGCPVRKNGSAGQPPALVVCPKSVMDNWRAEAQRFYSALPVRVWRGEAKEELARARAQAGLIVINYSQLRFLSPEIARTPWSAVILDEAQYIKNPDSQTAQAARALKTDHRLALTGTPIENRLLDLWSILSFSMPGALGQRAHFLRRFNAQDDPLARRRLAARVRPFLLRRTKGQVAKDLPDRVEEDLLCEMEGQQQSLYRAELKRARQLLLGLQSNKQLNKERFNILTSLLRLRQICCHPALVDGKLRDAEAAKVSALEDLLEPLMAEGHKVLVFSQFVTMLDLLQDLVQKREWPHFYLAGGTENRGDLVRDFQAAPGGAVFLISLKAGGFGLNLTAASYVVLFDPWWNPAVESQAIDRTHRIGQTSKVMAYRLIMRDSIEEKIRMLQKQKAALAEDVFGEERFSQSLTLDDLNFLFAE